MKVVYKALAALALTALATTASAQQYPEKPIRLVIPFPPGGGTDVVARVIAQKLGESTGWTLVADNKPGSGGSVGLSLAGKSAPDGYTIVLAQNANLVINPILGKANYDPIKDFAPIGLVASAPQVLVVAKDSPIKTVEDLIAAAKAKDGKLTFASPGVGTSSHLAGELIQQIAGVKFRHVPYKGAAGPARRARRNLHLLGPLGDGADQGRRAAPDRGLRDQARCRPAGCPDFRGEGP